MNNTPATIMARNLKARKSKLAHYFDLIKRHLALGIPQMPFTSIWLA